MGQDFTQDELDRLLRDRSNWGRWGDDDELGALNLITAAKRRQAAALVREGTTVSLSKVFPDKPAPDNPLPAQHYLVRETFPGEGACIDYYGISYHGYASTHLDALCHIWDDHGMWNGKDPDQYVGSTGASWGGVEKWAGGIVTRAVLADIPGYRGTGYVTADQPVTDHDLAAACEKQGVAVEPGDALLVYSGRDAYEAEHGPWGVAGNGAGRPGLDATTLRFLRDRDVSVLGWDMLDATPAPYRLRHTVHLALPAFGVALIDNCDLAPLAAACRAAGRYEVMLMVAPLVVTGGTGSPVNPIAVL